WERERAKLRKAREKQSAPKTSKQDRIFRLAVEARERALLERTAQPVSIPRNKLSDYDWQPEEWVDEDEALLFPYAKAEREAELKYRAELEAELKFRAEKAERDRELLQDAEQFIPPERIKGFAEGLLERASRYPRVKAALDKATAYADLERQVVIEEQKKPTANEHIRTRFLHAIEQDEDIESVVGDLADMFEEEVHDIYEIYFSPEVA